MKKLNAIDGRTILVNPVFFIVMEWEEGGALGIALTSMPELPRIDFTPDDLAEEVAKERFKLAFSAKNQDGQKIKVFTDPQAVTAVVPEEDGDYKLLAAYGPQMRIGWQGVSQAGAERIYNALGKE